MGCSGLYWTVLGWTRLIWAVVGCSRLYCGDWAVLGGVISYFSVCSAFPAWWQTIEQPTNQVILLQARSLPVWEGSLLQNPQQQWLDLDGIRKKCHSGVVTTTRALRCENIYVPLAFSLSSDWTFLSDFQEICTFGWKIVLLSQSLSHSLVVSGKHFKTPPFYPPLHIWLLHFLEEAITFTFFSNILWTSGISDETIYFLVVKSIRQGLRLFETIWCPSWDLVLFNILMLMGS